MRMAIGENVKRPQGVSLGATQGSSLPSTFLLACVASIFADFACNLHTGEYLMYLAYFMAVIQPYPFHLRSCIDVLTGDLLKRPQGTPSSPLSSCVNSITGHAFLSTTPSPLTLLIPIYLPAYDLLPSVLVFFSCPALKLFSPQSVMLTTQ